MPSDKFEITVQIFEENNQYYWSLIQDFGGDAEPLSYGLTDTFGEAVMSAAGALQELAYA